MTKIVINCDWGGFGLSEEACKEMNAYGCWMSPPPKPGQERWEGTDDEYVEWIDDRVFDKDIPRDDPKLVELVETRGSEWCSGANAKLKVVEIPDGVDWLISNYDGKECVEERHRCWA
jgi:hypothetical protein